MTKIYFSCKDAEELSFTVPELWIDEVHFIPPALSNAVCMHSDDLI